MNIIKKYEDKLIIGAQKDKGIYDAFNNGMMLAKGDYIGFLNSDDVYTDEALVLLNTYINKYPTKDFIFGAVKKHWNFIWF